ncbi:MAG TPA: T9SS type A sorting domain-containing protein, partial [Tenuifilaceae bacterium]|nr:T9SS type A sorting domain-containing protein [Tenuifilaceae bacterium]
KNRKSYKPELMNKIIYNNPAPEKLRILLNSETESISSVNIFSIIGQRVISNRYSDNSKEVEISTTDINSKIFIVEVILSNGYRKTFKVLK